MIGMQDIFCHFSPKIQKLYVLIIAKNNLKSSKFCKNLKKELKFQLILTKELKAKMFICSARYAAASRRTREKALLQQIWLIHIFQGDCLLADRRSKRIKSNRAAVVKFDDALKHPAVCGIEAELIHFQTKQRFIRDFFGDHTVGANLDAISDAPSGSISIPRISALRSTIRFNSAGL